MLDEDFVDVDASVEYSPLAPESGEPVQSQLATAASGDLSNSGNADTSTSFVHSITPTPTQTQTQTQTLFITPVVPKLQDTSLEPLTFWH